MHYYYFKIYIYSHNDLCKRRITICQEEQKLKKSFLLKIELLLTLSRSKSDYYDPLLKKRSYDTIKTRTNFVLHDMETKHMS